ncbi:MAG: hypothetical protein K6F00_02585 [Lachnospiraceae bacterium]|nr:hypothetical protein [Lachnospiraceae bacterium]
MSDQMKEKKIGASLEIKDQKAPEQLRRETELNNSLSNNLQDQNVQSSLEERHEMTEEELREIERRRYGDLFPELSRVVNSKTQRKLRIVTMNNSDVNAAYTENDTMLSVTIDAEEKNKPKNTKEWTKTQEKRYHLIDKIKELKTAAENSLDKVSAKLFNERKNEALSHLSGKPEEIDAAAGSLAKDCADFNKLIKTWSDTFGIIDEILQSDLEDEDLDYFTRFFDKDFIWEANEANDYKTIVQIESRRASMMESMLKGNPLMDTSRFVMPKVFIDGVVTRIKLENDVKEAMNQLSFSGNADPVKISDKILPEQSREVSKVTEWQQDVLMSSRFEMSLFKIMLAKLDNKDSVSKMSENESGYIKFCNKMYFFLTRMGDKISKQAADAADQGRDPSELFAGCVEMSKRFGYIYGHMNEIHRKLQKKSAEYSKYSFSETLDNMSFLMTAFTVMEDGKEQDFSDFTNFDTAMEKCRKITEDVDIILQNAEYEVDSEYKFKDKFGIESDVDYTGSVGEYCDAAEKILKEIKDRRKENIELNDKTKVTREKLKELDQEKKDEEAALKALQEEQQRLLDEQKTKDNQQTSESTIIKYVNAGENEYIPKSAIGKISKFTDYEGNKVEEVGKMKAFFDKNKLKGDALKERMEKHVRRFLSSKTGVTDKNMTEMANVITEGSMVLTKKEKSLDEVSKNRLSILERLYNNPSSEDIKSAFSDAITQKLIPANTDEKTELSYKSPYLSQHPHAAKIILMNKLLSMMDDNSLIGASDEYKGRVKALAHNVNLLNSALMQSDDYQAAVRVQRLAIIEGDIEAKRTSIVKLDEKILRFKPKTTLDDYEALINAQVEDFKNMKEGISKVAITHVLQRTKADSLRNLEKSEKELDSSYEAMLKSIKKSNWNALVNSKKVVLSSARDKEDAEQMAHGARAYFTTILRTDLLKDIPKDDAEEIIENSLKQIPFIMPKNKQDILKYTADDVRFLAGCVTERLRRAGDIKEIFAKDEGYRKYLLRRLISGRTFMTLEEYNTEQSEKSDKAMKAEGILSMCPSYRSEKTEYVRIIGIKKASFSNHMRGLMRVQRLTELTPLIESLFMSSGKTVPVSYHEFVESYKKGTDPVKAYDKYVDKCFDELKSRYGEKLPVSLEFAGKKYSSWASLSGLLKNNRSEYGADHDTGLLLDLLGEDLNKKKHDPYMTGINEKEAIYRKNLAELQSKFLKYNARVPKDMLGSLGEYLYGLKPPLTEEKIKALADFANNREKYEKDVERTEKRLTGFKELRGGRFAFLSDVLMKNEDFISHTVTDTEDEYEIFLASIVNKCEEVTKEILGHVYVDQYLIEKKTEIADFILKDQKKTVSEFLNLKAVDNDVENTDINGKTYKEILGSKLKPDSDPGSEDAIFCSLLFELILMEGASVVLDEARLNAEKSRLEENIKKYKQTFDVIKADLLQKKETYSIDGKPVELSETEMKALEVSLIHNERVNLVNSSNKEYAVNLEARLIKDVKAIIKDQILTREYIKTNNDIKDMALVIVEDKKKGRDVLNKLFEDSDELFRDAKIDEIGDVGKLLEYKSSFDEIMELSKSFMSDEFLESIFVTMLKRMVAHATAGKMTEFKTDKVILFQFTCFSMAVNDYLAENKNINKWEIRDLKKGLFELYGDQLINGRAKDIENNTEAVEYYKGVLSEMLGQAEGGIVALKYIINDTAGIEGFSNEQAQGEKQDEISLRKNINAILKKKSKTFKEELASYSNDDQIMFYYILNNRSELISLRKSIAKMTGNNENDNISINENATIMSYLKGGEISSVSKIINYSKIQNKITNLSNEELKKEIDSAVSIMKDLKSSKYDRSKLSEKKQNVVVNVKKDMEMVYSSADSYMSDIKNDKMLTNREKLWRFYTVLRTYSNIFDAYHNLKEQGKINPEETDKNGMYDIYSYLQEYFAVGDVSENTVRKIYSTFLCVKLGIYTEEQFNNKEKLSGLITETILRDKKRNEAKEKNRNYIFNKTGEKTKIQNQIVDNEEKEYPSNVVSAVKKIDQWIAANALEWKGDSESNFGIEILSHPIRERLFVYYTIEKEKQILPSGLDAALSVNSYVPNFDTFVDKMSRSRFNVIHSAASYAKKINFIKKTGVLSTFGQIMTQKIETSIRLLDDDTMKIREYIERLSKNRSYANNEKMPEEVRVREGCYLALLKEVEIQKSLLNGKSDEENKNNINVKRQSRRVIYALRRLARATENVELLTGETIPKDDLVKLNSMVDQRIVNRETEVDFKEHAGTLIAKLADIQGDSVLYTKDIVDKIVGTVLAIREASQAEGVSTSGRIAMATDAFETTGDIVESVCNFASFLNPLAKETIGNISDGVTGGITALAGSIKTVVAISQYQTVSKNEEAALTYADEISEMEKDQSKHYNVDFKDAVKNVAAMQKRVTKAEATSNALKAAGGVVSLIGAVVPGAATVTTAIGGIITIVNKIHAFWANKDQREKTIDEFLDMDAMYQNFKPDYDTFDEETKELYGKSESDIKASLRKEALIAMHFSTMEEFFKDISTQYATLLYRHIFFDDNGKQILASNVEEIRKRSPLFALFPSMRFGYPQVDGQWPSPSMEEMATNLMREVS